MPLPSPGQKYLSAVSPAADGNVSGITDACSLHSLDYHIPVEELLTTIHSIGGSIYETLSCLGESGTVHYHMCRGLVSALWREELPLLKPDDLEGLRPPIHVSGTPIPASTVR
jgi:hypothetical protein